jgi:hypothetical protein
VIGELPVSKRLPNDQLQEVLLAPEEDRRDLLIAGTIDAPTKTITLTRGNLATVVCPFSLVLPSGKAKPNFRDFSLVDYGHGIRLGNYEATTDVILWELDADYRKRRKQIERDQAEGFGASLRRLRIQRQLTQSDFPGISRQEIARLESGEVASPQKATRDIIAKTLGVAPEEIETY